MTIAVGCSDGEELSLPPLVPAPGDLETVKSAVQRMPDRVAGIERIDEEGDPGAYYRAPPGKLLWIEADEVAGVEARLAAAGGAAQPPPGFDDYQDCGDDDRWCWRGSHQGGGLSVIWGERGNSIAVTAFALDPSLMAELLDAWSEAAGA